MRRGTKPRLGHALAWTKRIFVPSHSEADKLNAEPDRRALSSQEEPSERNQSRTPYATTAPHGNFGVVVGDCGWRTRRPRRMERKPEAGTAQPRKLYERPSRSLLRPGRSLCFRGRADKNGPNRSLRITKAEVLPMRCRTVGGQSLRAKLCQSDVGVFRHAPTERGGGGGKVDGRVEIYSSSIDPVKCGLNTDRDLVQVIMQVFISTHRKTILIPAGVRINDDRHASFKRYHTNLVR